MGAPKTSTGNSARTVSISPSCTVMVYVHCRTWTRILIRVRISTPKMGSVTIGDPDLDRSLCSKNSFCIVQCNHWVLSRNPSRCLSPCATMYISRKNSPSTTNTLIQQICWSLI